MKSIYVLISTLLICIPLLFLQFSCGAIREKQEEAIPQVTDEKMPNVLLLEDKHKESGVECSDCHENSNPVAGVSATQCLGCHENYKEVASSYLDPHNAHNTSSECDVCHHVHKPSEKICQGCHSFNVQAS